MTILVASTTAPWIARRDPRLTTAWLDNAEAMAAWAEQEMRESLAWFCAIEVDGDGIGLFRDLTDRLTELDDQSSFTVPRTTWWKCALDDGTYEATSGNRLHRICMGRNLCHEYAQANPEISRLVLLDSDVTAADDLVPRLAEVDHPIVGGHVPIYALDGPRLSYAHHDELRDLWMLTPLRGSWTWQTGPKPFPERADVREHWNTAGCLMLTRDAFRRLRWRYDLDAGLTDDPATQRTAVELGMGETWVRHDVIATHVPVPMIPVEERDGDRKRRSW